MSDDLSKYRGPWIVLLVFICGAALAVVWMLAEVKRTKQIHDLSYPAPVIAPVVAGNTNHS
jgi:hypothetical protein